MMKRFGWLLLFGAIALGGFHATTRAQSSADADRSDGVETIQAQSSADAEEGDLIDLEALTCEDFLKAEGEDRTNLLIFLHGYMNGTMGDMTINGPVLAEASDNVVDACIDGPERQLFGVFEEYR